MTSTTWTIDLFKPFWAVAVFLLIFGVIPFTPAAVGILLLTHDISLTISWSR